MKNKERKPLSFGGTMLASICGMLIITVVSWLIMMFFSAMMVVGLTAGSSSDKAVVKSNTYLNINLTSEINERSQSDLQKFLGDSKSAGLCDMVKAVKAAASDNHVEGILLQFGPAFNLSWAATEELREAVSEFKSTGKPVIAYAEGYSQKAYYLSTIADSIFIHPAGMLELTGIGGTMMYYKDLLDKLGLQMQLIRPASCDYKSAGEVYTMNHMSQANREQTRAYMMDIWHHVARQIADSRQLTVGDLNGYADNLAACLPQDAVKAGLIDRVCVEHDVRNLIKSKLNGKHLMSVGKYVTAMKPQKQGNDRIAIVYAEGEVSNASGDGLTVGVFSKEMVKAIDAAAKNDHVKAIVLRINSPGGDATASESITSAIIRAREKKPVVVSMSGLAASAGYEIACHANTIVAQPTTITGSIGVFATIPNLDKLLSSKLGINTDTVQTNHNSTGLNMLRPLSPTALALLQKNVDNFYDNFTSHVASGRGLQRRFVDSIARGRVWSGNAALELGLVDTLGGLETALSVAADLASLESYTTVEYPKQKDVFSQLMSLTGSSDNDDIELSFMQKIQLYHLAKKMKKQGSFIKTAEQEIDRMTEWTGIQARLPYILIED